MASRLQACQAGAGETMLGPSNPSRQVAGRRRPPLGIAGALLWLTLAAGGGSVTEASPSGSASVTVGATAVAYARVVALEHPHALEVSTEDVERGFVDAQAAVSLTVMTNSPSGYFLSVGYVGNLLVGCEVGGLERMRRLGGQGGRLLRHTDGFTRDSLVLDLRFYLSKNVVPGVYYWPLELAVSVNRRP